MFEKYLYYWFCNHRIQAKGACLPVWKLTVYQMICVVQELSSHDYRSVVIKLCAWFCSLRNYFLMPNPVKAKYRT